MNILKYKHNFCLVEAHICSQPHFAIIIKIITLTHAFKWYNEYTEIQYKIHIGFDLSPVQ